MEELKSEKKMDLLLGQSEAVEIRKDNGSLIRSIGNGDAKNAKWYGSEVAISTNKGKTELRKENGSLIRTL